MGICFFLDIEDMIWHTYTCVGTYILPWNDPEILAKIRIKANISVEIQKLRIAYSYDAYW